MIETTDSQEAPIVERLAPQTSIRFIAMIIVVCALIMFTFRQAVVSDQLWAKCVAAIIASVIGCFVAYLLVFLVANLASGTTAAVAELPKELSQHDTPNAPPSPLTKNVELTDDDMDAFSSPSKQDESPPRQDESKETLE